MTLFQQTAVISASRGGRQRGPAASSRWAHPAPAPTTAAGGAAAPAARPLEVSVNQRLRNTESISASAEWAHFLVTFKSSLQKRRKSRLMEVVFGVN